ncbi:hypothetical protein PIGHUM_00060 [Pigmentiphaga humi]|uniref:SPOR domain-containing protein n=1 Tax=Pigmentiphaga humi TaxID=2478468 RepID=A0A3P4AVG3_9BURK|nr:SPOR domain-containing protein [Pigmentiphaga humi]VCU68013.1 hypothetical protein PIGHUM_00060 [Pigmentiphaga humi]
MRSLFVILLLANVALFALDHGWFGQPISERGRDPARLRTEIRADTIQVPRLPGMNATAETVPVAPAEAPVSPAPEPAAPRPPAASTDAPGAAAPAGPGETAAGDATATAPGEAAEAAERQAAAPSQAAPLTPAPASTPVELACREWGALAEAELAGARKWASERLPHARQDIRRENGKPGWMVIVPPLPNAAAVQAAAAQLGKSGVKDYFVIQEGPLQHAISLGVFSTEAGAKKHAAALQEQGVRNARVLERASLAKGWLRLEGLRPADLRTLDEARQRYALATLRACP